MRRVEFFIWLGSECECNATLANKPTQMHMAICTGNFEDSYDTAGECLAASLEQFRKSKWNANLMRTVEQSQKFFRFRPTNETFETLPIVAGDWTTLSNCRIRNHTSRSWISGVNLLAAAQISVAVIGLRSTRAMAARCRLWCIHRL